MTKYKSVILDEFESDLNCPICDKKTLHIVQKVDEEGDGEFIGYYAKCEICDHIEDLPSSNFE